MGKHLYLVSAALLCLGASAWSAEEDVDKKVADLVKELDDGDAAKRAAAETKIRELGAEALPALRKAEVTNKEGLVRLRTIIMELSVKHAKIDATDANMLMQLAREEALAKRYGNAAKGYERAEKLYEKLEDDADDRKDEDAEKDFDKKKDRAKERKKKAERLAKGQEHKVSHWGPIPTIKKVEDDGDW